jgi:two-component sensor histidine kinase
LSVDAICLNVDTAVPCGLILNELLSNSLKHAFPGGREGMIRVSLKKTGSDRIDLSVADNGIGLPVDFRLENSRSLGLQVVTSLTHQIRADLVVSREGGATFRIGWQLPAPEEHSGIRPPGN